MLGDQRVGGGDVAAQGYLPALLQLTLVHRDPEGRELR